MANFNDLIKEDPELAAGIIQDGFRHIVNTMIPNIYLSNEEWHQLSKIIFSGQAKCAHEESENNTDSSTEENG